MIIKSADNLKFSYFFSLVKLTEPFINIVQLNQRIANIIINEALNIKTYVSTSEVQNIHIGDNVRIISRNRIEDIEYTGTIKSIAKNAEVKTSVLGVGESKIEINISADENYIKLVNGSDVDIEFTIFKKENQLLIPSTAIFEENNKYWVWKIEDKILPKKEVEKGSILGTETTVLNGIESGNYIIKDASNKILKDGIKFTIQ